MLAGLQLLPAAIEEEILEAIMQERRAFTILVTALLLLTLLELRLQAALHHRLRFLNLRRSHA